MHLAGLGSWVSHNECQKRHHQEQFRSFPWHGLFHGPKSVTARLARAPVTSCCRPKQPAFFGRRRLVTIGYYQHQSVLPP